VRAVRLVVWSAGAALSTVMLMGAIRGGDVLAWYGRGDAFSPATGNVFLVPPDQAAAGYAGALVALTLGVLVWERRPDSRTGILLTAFALTGTLTDPIVFPGSRLAMTVGLATFGLTGALAAHLILSYPTGRFTSRLERGFVAIGYGFALVYAAPLLLFYSPQTPHEQWFPECLSCAEPLTHVAWHDVTGLKHALDGVQVVLIVLFMALLLRKLVRAVPVARNVALPLAVVAFVAAARFALLIGLRLFAPSSDVLTSPAWFWSGTFTGLAITLALSAGLLWGGAGRGAVADLVVELERTPPGSVRGALARALGDPSLELALWLPERAAYVDAKGRPLTLPPNGSDRAVTVLGPAEAPVAALVHDPALLERPALLTAAGAAARFALENERLQAELRLQLAEVHASRARIVEAGEEERRRLERDLHDGAQQRLLSLGLALQLARSELGPRPNGAATLLGEAEAELAAALEELRALAQGIHPAVLTEHGLGPALRTLAARSPLPVEIRHVPDERLPAPVEAAAYFVVSEALANVAKHAHASAAFVSIARRADSLEVEVQDDGVGGAEPRAGSGLAGLADRVHTLEGRLTIESKPGHGTCLRAKIPYAPVAAER
jgi:signal transduction histidine kinase